MIQKLIPILFTVVSGYSYELIETFDFSFKEINLDFCNTSSETFIDSVNNVTKYLNTIDYLPDFNKKPTSKIVPICEIDMPTYQYGYTRFSTDNDFREILISKRLSDSPNARYNVILHEFVHLFGLTHVDDFSQVMGYKVTLDVYRNIIEDEYKYILGEDDIDGLKSLYENNEDEDIDFVCNKKRIIKLIKHCL